MKYDEFPSSAVLSGSDWQEAIDLAQNGGTATVGPRSVPSDPITLDDVAAVEAWWAESDGSTEERYYGDLNMVALLRLHDGRYASLSAWCDTTGWGCQDDSQVRLGDRDSVVRFGLGDGDREKLGLTL